MARRGGADKMNPFAFDRSHECLITYIVQLTGSERTLRPALRLHRNNCNARAITAHILVY